MSTRVERDCARIRCLTAAVSSLHCEIARIVNAGENQQQLDDYAAANLAKGDTEEGLLGLSMDDLVLMLGSLSTIELLISRGASVEQVRSMMRPDGMDETMWKDILLYLEGITRDRQVEASDVEA